MPGSSANARQGADEALSQLTISVTDVTRVFSGRRGAGEVCALSGLSLRVRAGEIVTVVGPSGCGKSTLLELICGLQRPDAGSVVAAPAVLMAQRDLLLPWLSAADNAALPLRLRGMAREAAWATVEPWFERFGLHGFEHAHPHELSGGMRQRVAFTRTLLSGKPVLALDEPFVALDALTRAEMQDWLAGALASERAAGAQPRTVVLVTHDVEEAALLGDRVVVLSPRPGRVVADIPARLERPRRRIDPALVALRAQALEALGAAA